MFDLGPIPSRFLPDAALVRRLVAAQFPDWAGLPVRPVATQGWDNRTFHLGAELLVRLPTAAEYALAVDKEHEWLPVLAPQLPLPVPVPVGKGEPGEGFAHHWSVYEWIAGTTARAEAIEDSVGFATDLAGFLASLQRIEPSTGPGPGTHNWFRGGPLGTFEDTVSDSVDALSGHVDVVLAQEAWRSALDAVWDGRPVWFHGDVAPGNLLVRGGVLRAVIDFGTCGVGDPACDLAIAWTLLAGESRHSFREALSVDAGTWTRGRGWALWKTLAECAADVREDHARPPSKLGVLEEILSDYRTSRRG